MKHDFDGALGWALLLLTLTVGCYSVARSIELRLSAFAEGMFGVLAAVVALLIVAGLLSKRRPPTLSGALTTWAFLMGISLLQVPVARNASSLQALTDAVVMLLPALMAVAIGLSSDSRAAQARFLMAVTGVSVAAAWVGHVTAIGSGRYEAPTVFAIVGAWVLATTTITEGAIRASRQHLVHLLAFIAAVTLLVPILGSRQRTALIVWVVAGLLSVALAGTLQRLRLVALTAAPVCIVALILGYGSLTSTPTFSAVLEQSRLETVLNGQTRETSGERLDEVADVTATMSREGSILDYAVGFGHGATYLPQRSNTGISIDPETSRIHHVHATPVMLLFRYGIVGLAAFACLIAFSIRSSFRHLRIERDFTAKLLVIMLICYCIDMLLRNSFVDAGFAITIALLSIVQDPKRHLDDLRA